MHEDVPCETCRVPEPEAPSWQERRDALVGWVWFVLVLLMASMAMGLLVEG